MTMRAKSAQAEIKNMKYRLEGSGEGAEVPLDIQIECSLDGAVMRHLAGSDNAASFWRSNEGKDPMYPLLGEVVSNLKVKYATMKISTITTKNCTLSKFKASVEPGGIITMQFNCAAYELTAQDVDSLKMLLKKQIEVEIAGEIDEEDQDDQENKDQLRIDQ